MIKKKTMEGRGNALKLKPNVTITEENVNKLPDTLKDQDIRPSLPHIAAEEESTSSETDMDHNTVVHTRCPEGNTENHGMVENSMYSVLTVSKNSVSCSAVILGDIVIFGKCQEEVNQEKPGETLFIFLEEKYPEETSEFTTDEADELTKETSESSNHKFISDAHLMRIKLQNLESELLNKSPLSVLKVSKKRQRSKKLGDLLGAFDTFHYFNPAAALQSWTVYPVSKKTMTLTNQDSREDEKSPSPPDPPRGGEEKEPPLSWPPEFVYGRPWADFSHELYRLGTFASLPSDFPIFVLSLAQAGFVCLPNGGGPGPIICFFCKARRDRWNPGDSPWEVHRQLNPACPLLTGGQEESGNVPVMPLSAGQLRAAMEIWALSGSGSPRGAAGVSGPFPPQAGKTTSGSSLQTQNIASSTNTSRQAGQNFNNNQQQATVATGRGRTSSDSTIEPGEGVAGQVLEGTARPEAPPGRNNGLSVEAAPPPSPRGSGEGSGSESRSVTYKDLGIITDPPKRPDMATVSARLASFNNWPSTHAQTPLALSEAGYYYAGYADCGRCFQCGGGLKNWEASDNPWVEHARWFDKCQYVKQCQGQDFIDIVSELNRNSPNERPEITMEQVQEKMRERRVGWLHEDSEDPAITAVRAAGYGPEDVRLAVQSLTTDGEQLTAERLVDLMQAEGAVAVGELQNLEEVQGDLVEAVRSLASENSEIRQRRMCKVCLDREVSQVFLPCGHLVCCSTCSSPMRVCPMCRQRIKGRVRAFPAN